MLFKMEVPNGNVSLLNHHAIESFDHIQLYMMILQTVGVRIYCLFKMNLWIWNPTQTWVVN